VTLLLIKKKLMTLLQQMYRVRSSNLFLRTDIELTRNNYLKSHVDPSGFQALKNPNPLKDVEALAVLAVAVLV